MKQRKILCVAAVLLALILAALLVVLGKMMAAPAEQTEPSTGESVLQQTQPATQPEEPVETDSTEQTLSPEPSYVYLEEEKQDDDLIFAGWMSQEEAQIEADINTEGGTTGQLPEIPDSDQVAKYQDVSELDNAIAIPSVYVEPGTEFTVPLRVCGQVRLCALDIRVGYDPEKLDFLGFEGLDDDAIANCVEEDGIIYLNYLRTVNVEQTLDLCSIRFQPKIDAGSAALEVVVMEVVCVDSDNNIILCNFETVDGTVFVEE